MVVVGRFAAHVGVLTGRQVQALHGAKILEDLERPEDRGATHAEVLVARRVHQVGRREVAVLLGDQRRQRPAWLGQAVAGAFERGHDRGGVAHAGVPTTVETQSQRKQGASRGRCNAGSTDADGLSSRGRALDSVGP